MPSDLHVWPRHGTRSGTRRASAPSQAGTAAILIPEPSEWQSTWTGAIDPRTRASVARHVDGDHVLPGAATPDFPVDGTNLFPAASCSKAVAALASLRLAERGTLDLDAPIEELLTTWKPPARPFYGPVTVRSILAHRAGLSIHGVPGYDKGDPKARTCREELAHALEFLEEPGTRFRYSGGGFMLLEAILEDVTGRDFNALMEDEILRPLGMSDSTFVPFRPPYEARMACGHHEDGSPVAWRQTPGLAAAWLHTTPPDLARFLIAVYRASRLGETNVIRPRTARLMLTPTGTAEGRYGAFTSLGFFLTDTPAGRTFFHRGTNRGYRCGMWMQLKTGDGLVVMTNSANGEGLCTAVYEAVFPEAKP